MTQEPKMIDVSRLPLKQLKHLAATTEDDDLREEALEELEYREEMDRFRDFREQDDRAAAEERLDNIRREF